MDFFRDKKKNPFLSHIIHYTKQKRGATSHGCPRKYSISIQYMGLHHAHTGSASAHRHRRHFLLDVGECTLGGEQHSGY